MQTHPSKTAQDSPHPLIEVAAFLVAAFGLSWLIALPLWLDERHLQAPYALPLMVLFMFTPLASVAVVHLLFRPGNLRFAFALHFEKRLIKPLLLAWFLPMPLVLSSLFLAFLLGWFTPDLEHFSSLQAILDEKAPGVELPLPLGFLVLLQLAQGVALAPLNMLATVGEELGWRGFLHHRLRSRFSWLPSSVVIGVIWGLWHTPLLLLGYNYPSHPMMGPLLFVVFCVLLSIPLGALRERTTSSWPAILAHAAVNAAAGATVLLSNAAFPPDNALVGLIGVSGWVVMLPVVVMSIYWGYSKPTEDDS